MRPVAGVRWRPAYPEGLEHGGHVAASVGWAGQHVGIPRPDCVLVASPLTWMMQCSRGRASHLVEEDVNHVAVLKLEVLRGGVRVDAHAVKHEYQLVALEPLFGRKRLCWEAGSCKRVNVPRATICVRPRSQCASLRDMGAYVHYFKHLHLFLHPELEFALVPCKKRAHGQRLGTVVGQQLPQTSNSHSCNHSIPV